MKLTSVSIQNFRCIKDITVDLDDTTVLIGENNSGKTAFLEAIRICLDLLRGRSRNIFHEFDYHLSDINSTPADSLPIAITLHFVEPSPSAWGTELIQELDKIAVLRGDGRYAVTFRLTSNFDNNAGEFLSEWSFLDTHGNPMTGSAKNTSQLLTLQRLVPTFYLSALRDASRHFASRGQFWRIFLSESSIPEADRKLLELEFSALNEKLISSHQPLTEVQRHLENAKNVIDFGTGDAISIDALPTKLFSLLSRTQVNIASREGAKIPVERQGEGTQSLAVLLLFDAFLRNQLSELDPISKPITALEEPESHLHPSAIRSLMGVVNDLPGQTILSTHSGDLIAATDPLSVRRFVHRDGKIQTFSIQPNSLEKDEIRKFNFHVRQNRGELLFARCWLLVEGETESILYSGAAEVLKIDLERAGVRIVEFGQSDVGMLAKVANEFGIEWYCVIDNDNGRKKYENRVKSQIINTTESERCIFPYENIEKLLCENGFGSIYETEINPNKTQPTAPHGSDAYWGEVLNALPKKFSKPAAALEAVLEMQNGKTVPDKINEILIKTLELSRV